MVEPPKAPPVEIDFEGLVKIPLHPGKGYHGKGKREQVLGCRLFEGNRFAMHHRSPTFYFLCGATITTRNAREFGPSFAVRSHA
jgi:hypothetical protein